MKRELKASSTAISPRNLRIYRKAHPDEKGTERAAYIEAVRAI